MTHLPGIRGSLTAFTTAVITMISADMPVENTIAAAVYDSISSSGAAQF